MSAKSKQRTAGLIEVNTGQSLRSAGQPQVLHHGDAGMDSISFDGSGTLWRLEVTALPGKIWRVLQ